MLPSLPRLRLVPVVCAALLAASPAFAGVPLDPSERKAIAGQPTALEVLPGEVKLAGIRDARQLIVTGKYADGSVRDLTAISDAKVEPAGIVDLQEGLFLRPKKNGSATLVITVGGKEARVPITVAGMEDVAPTSF